MLAFQIGGFTRYGNQRSKLEWADVPTVVPAAMMITLTTFRDCIVMPTSLPDAMQPVYTPACKSTLCLEFMVPGDIALEYACRNKLWLLNVEIWGILAENYASSV